jgi:hypothetical protein
MKLQPLRVEVRKAVLRKQSFFAPKQEIPALGNSDLLFRRLVTTQSTCRARHQGGSILRTTRKQYAIDA